MREPIPNWLTDPVEVICAPVSATRPAEIEEEVSKRSAAAYHAMMVKRCLRKSS